MRERNLRATDGIMLAVLAATAVAIGWECARRDVSANALSLGAAALLLFVGLGGPWRFRRESTRWNVGLLLLSSLGVLIGLATDLVLPIAFAWSAGLWAWLQTRLETPAKPRVARLLLLSLFIFPWVDLDLKPLSWWLRITSAAAVESTLATAGLETAREGTVVFVSGQPVEVNEHCAGRETLHAMLVVGLAAAHVFLGPQQLIWPWLAVLPALAWLANSLRVLLVCLGAMWFEQARYRDWLHDGGGWLVVGLMLGLCMLSLACWKRTSTFIQLWNWNRSNHAEPSSLRLPRWRFGQFRGMPFQQLGLGVLLLSCLVIGGVWRLVPLDNAQARLQQLSRTVAGRVVPLSESEQRRLGAAAAVKRVCRVGGREFLVTAIDGTANRRAVHDPAYCWTVTESSELPVRGGQARLLRALDDGTEKEVLFWFSDGASRYTSPVRYLFQTSLRRATFGRFGQEPVLVLVEPVISTPVNWFRFLDSASWLMEL
ncbi:MAG: exosortase/archaeosortase family protein [Planctomycetota bacterium]|nr:exosortase/archaeosortase family protein [Planctomycetota bacterium]